VPMISVLVSLFRITEHLASCSDCYFVLSESAQALRSAEPPRTTIADRLRESFNRWHEVFSVPRVRWASAGAVLATAAAVWLVVGSDRLMPGRRANAQLQALVTAVGTDRTIEGRLTGGFAYGPLRGPVRSGVTGGFAYGPLRGPALSEVAVPPSVAPDVRIAAAHSEKALAALNTPEALHAMGLASLVVGDLDRAIPMFERAVAQPSPNPQFLTDLAAAYLARAARENRHQDLDKALAAADRAVKSNPTLAEAVFNRALALDRLSLTDEARTAWQDYLNVDDTSGWADEARAHLQGRRR